MGFKALAFKFVHQPWRSKKAIWILILLELAGLIPCLVLFAFAKPDTFRTQLWEVGYELGLNSNPDMILYDYANHTPVTGVPFVWAAILTRFNVIISVASLFILIAKMVTFIMEAWFPLLALVFNIALVGLYATSVGGQMGPDYADKSQPSSMAWYIRLSCDVAKPFGAYAHCEMAKGTFAATVYMLAVYLANVGMAIWSMLPNKNRDQKDDDDEESQSGSPTAGKQVEMQPVVSTREIPFTPRTQAFHTLDRKLPLRYS